MTVPSEIVGRATPSGRTHDCKRLLCGTLHFLLPGGGHPHMSCHGRLRTRMDETGVPLIPKGFRIEFLGRRRQFITLLGGAAAAWPLATRAQQPERMRRIGVVMPFAESDPQYQGSVASFRDALVKGGWVEGRNLRTDSRWAGGDVGKLSGYAAELVALMPDAIFVMNSVAVAALQRATRSAPIVFADVPDPVAAGFVSSVARPGGNITGLALYEHAIGAKRLELLKQLAPGVTRVLFIYDPSSPIWSVFFAETEAAASSLGVKASAAPVHNVAEIEAAIDAFAREPNGGLITLAHPPVIAHRDKVFTLAARHRL